MNPDAKLLSGFLLGVALIPLLTLVLRCFVVRVNEGEAVLVSRFGRLVAAVSRPGWHVLFDRMAPWIDMRRISTRREMRNLSVVVSDASGTSVDVDVFVELRITDPQKACYAVSDWERALANVVSHAVVSVLANRDFYDILRERTELADEVRRETASETARWGIRLERLMLRNVSVSPEVGEQMVRSIAARIERWKANIVEAGRQRVAKLEAKTTTEIAVLLAKARATYPSAIGRAFEVAKKNPRVCEAYNELYELSLYHPQRTIAFVGFKDDEVRHVDAAMLAIPPNQT